MADILDFNDLDFHKLKGTKGGPQKKGEGLFFKKKVKLEDEERYMIPNYLNYCAPASSLTGTVMENLLEFFNSDGFCEYLGLEVDQKYRTYSLNGIEVAAKMMKHLPNAHIVNISFSYTPEYYWGNSEMGLLDLETKFKDLKEEIIGHSLVFESIMLGPSSMRTYSLFSTISGGLTLFLPDYSENYNT